LIRIPSVIGNERAIADHVQAWAEDRGLHEVVRADDNLALRPRAPREDRPRLLLLGHLDTVPVSDENPARLEGDRLYGLGASDMKCADALILHLLEQCLEQEPRYDVTAVLYACEEGPFDESGMPEIVAAAPWFFEGVDLAVAMEPTDNHIELGCLGTMHGRVRFEGRRAHSARPWEGRNAIHMAAPLLERLAAAEPRDVDFDGLRFREVLSATMVEYSGARNVVPGACDVNVNFRFGPDRTREEAVAWFSSFVAEAVGADAIRDGLVGITVTDVCPSGRVCSDNPLLDSLRAAAPDSTQVRAKQAWTDVGRLSEMGLDAVNLGPGSGSQAHQVGEYCLRANLEAARELMESWLGLES
jgi:succinyl-diaminopimelate desuccinylase